MDDAQTEAIRRVTSSPLFPFDEQLAKLDAGEEYLLPRANDDHGLAD